MECLGALLGIVPCLWECSGKHAAYIGNLEKNLTSLRSEMLKLKDLSQDVKNKVKEAEEQRMRRTNQVSGWLESVEATDKEVGEILQSGVREVENKCVGSCCPKNCLSSYKLGKKVKKMITLVMGLTEEGQFDVVADRLPPPPVDELPMDNVVVGFETMFQEVWQSVQNKDFPVIGLVGIGGVGKTTLLKQLNNEFSKTSQGFDLIIWIVVAKPANIGRVQEAIRNKLNIADHLWGNSCEVGRAIIIYNILKNKKFVVLLDDIWERLELSDVGIPQPTSKIVFTTRSREVCLSMEAKMFIEVGCLPSDQALSLFCSKIGEDVLKYHPEIRELVKDVASECQGLPLALITIGRAMNGKTDAQQWKDAKRKLERYPATFPGMEGHVFSKLVFSYDYLPTPTLQKCFEYCSLYPEGHGIEKEEIIKLWLAEGLIDEYDSMHDILVQGRQIIQSLMQASLLETGEWEETVKMHDMIRDMALWVACERGEKRRKYWVDVTGESYGGTSTAHNTEKVSLWGPKITVESLAWLSFCHNLFTLIIRDTELEELHGEFFHSMKALKVLDLSCNYGLKELPADIGVATNLEYLNIRDTKIRLLPVDTEQLKKLRTLIVDPRTLIPKGVISSCRLLHIFEQSSDNSLIMALPFDKPERPISMETELLRELEGLKYIKYLHFTLTSATTMQILLDSPKLISRSISQLHLLSIKEFSSVVIDLGEGTLTNNLETLRVSGCYHTTKIYFGRSSSCNNLCKVEVFICDKIRNLNSLIYAPNLCILSVALCKSMEELIGEETMTNVGTSLFSRLTHLNLRALPKLKSICPHAALPFPALELMRVVNCDNLRKLPLDSNSALTTPPQLKIVGQKEWWDELQWDSQAIKDAFTPRFYRFDTPTSTIVPGFTPPFYRFETLTSIFTSYLSLHYVNGCTVM